MDAMAVANIEEFKHKYGNKKAGQLIEEFVRLCPEFPEETFEQGRQLVRELGIMCADLECALRDVRAYRAE